MLKIWAIIEKSKNSYDKDNNYKIVSDDLYKNGIFDNNDNEIANNIYRKVTIPHESKVEKNRKKNDISSQVNSLLPA